MCIRNYSGQPANVEAMIWESPNMYLSERLFHEPVVHGRLINAVFDFFLNRNLFLAHRAPELDGLQGDGLVVFLRGFRGEVENRGDVRREFVVVVLGDAD
jgi:hypothetical protein